jgi:methylase of polypeptide subunit release factors
MSLFENTLKLLDPSLRILELGCGSGLLFAKISHIPFKSYTAVDVSENAIKKFEASLRGLRRRYRRRSNRLA